MQQMLALRARCKAQASDGEDTANALPVWAVWAIEFVRDWALEATLLASPTAD
jgi:hypothetical protein